MQELSDDMLEGLDEIGRALFGDKKPANASRQAAWRLVNNGHLPVTKLGRKIFARRSELARVFQGTPITPDAA